jgi:hypothetical protein
MDLAMTYASRSHHLRLARQISQLSQQKYPDNSDVDLSDVEEDTEWTNQNDQVDHEFNYAKERNKSLQKGLSRTPVDLAGQNGSSRHRSKYDKYMKAMKRKKFSQVKGSGSHTHSATTESEYVLIN